MSPPDVKDLTTGELDALLAAVSLERAKREPPVAMEQPQQMEAAIDPKWYISLANGATFLQLRHPGYGWVGYLLPPASRATLLSFLLQHALLPATPEAQPLPVSTGGGTVH